MIRKYLDPSVQYFAFRIRIKIISFVTVFIVPVIICLFWLQVTPVTDYYIVAGVVYQAPDVGTLLNSRSVSPLVLELVDPGCFQWGTILFSFKAESCEMNSCEIFRSFASRLFRQIFVSPFNFRNIFASNFSQHCRLGT